MKKNSYIVKWALDSLHAKGFKELNSPELVVETPWSSVIRFFTLQGWVYLKQMPEAIALEPKVMCLLAEQFHANVPRVIAINDKHHCFLMKDGGLTLRAYLKANFQPELLCKAIKDFTALQRNTEDNTQSLLDLGLPDWRLDKLPQLYEQLISQDKFLKEEQMTKKELSLLSELTPQFTKQCELLAQYRILPTFAQADFHCNNILFDPKINKITFIDLGETVITHPFFSLQNFLRQAHIHHGVKEGDAGYHQLQAACLVNWCEFTQNQLLEAFSIAKTLWPIYSALGAYRLMNSINLNAFRLYYANTPNRLARYLKEYLNNNG